MIRAADEATVLVVDDDEDMRTVFMLGLARDTLDRILRVARDSLGYDLSREVGTFRLGGNETPLLGRVDWQLAQKHTLTLRDSFISLTQLNDRVSTTPSGPGDFLSNGGLYQTVANSVAGSITSHLTASLTNELRLQWATEDKPRRMNPAGQFGAPVPQVVINNIGSDGRSNTTDVIFGSDPALHANRLGTRTYHYRVNTNFGRAAPTQFTLNQQFQVQLGIRYDF